jgi:DNA-directed RNA polymerase subunit RPC12/RpoP
MGKAHARWDFNLKFAYSYSMFFRQFSTTSLQPTESIRCYYCTYSIFALYAVSTSDRQIRQFRVMPLVNNFLS